MMRIANKVLIFVAVYLVLFSAVQIYSFLTTGIEQTQLIESTYLVFGAEVGGLLVKRVLDKRWEKKGGKFGSAGDTEESADEAHEEENE